MGSRGKGGGSHFFFFVAREEVEDPAIPGQKRQLRRVSAGRAGVVGHLQTLTLFLSVPSSLPPFHPSLFQWRGRSKRDNGPPLPPLSSQQWRCILSRGRSSEPRGGAPLDAFLLSPPFPLLLPTIPSLCLYPMKPEQTVIFPSLNSRAALYPSKHYSKSCSHHPPRYQRPQLPPPPARFLALSIQRGSRASPPAGTTS